MEITDENDLKKFIIKYETPEKYLIFINKSYKFWKKSKEFEEIIKNSIIRLIITNLSDKNLELIKSLSNIINVQGIIIMKR